MTLDDIIPETGAQYRHRYSGEVSTLKRYDRPRPGRCNTVYLEGPGLSWWGTRESFWHEWLHADLTPRKIAKATDWRSIATPKTTSRASTRP